MQPALRCLPTSRSFPRAERAADEPLRLAEAASLIAAASLALWGVIGALAWSVLG